MTNFTKVQKRKHDASNGVFFNIVRSRGWMGTQNYVHLWTWTQAVDAKAAASTVR